MARNRAAPHRTVMPIPAGSAPNRLAEVHERNVARFRRTVTMNMNAPHHPPAAGPPRIVGLIGLAAAVVPVGMTLRDWSAGEQVGHSIALAAALCLGSAAIAIGVRHRGLYYGLLTASGLSSVLSAVLLRLGR